MNTAAVVVASPNAVAHAATAQEIKAQVQRIQQVMKAVMKSGTHYGKIPGAGDKNTLFKPGAEVLCATFHIAPSFKVDDMSDHDSIRYRVTCVGVHQSTGIVLGEGMGEASSNEEKYKWRNSVCDEEFEEADADRKRVKWQRGRDGAYKRYMIRTEAADIANTVLKMACKRSHVAMTLNVLAASDIFTQDLEDMPEELREGMDDERQQRDETPARKPATQAPRGRSSNGNGNGGGKRCTESQARLIGARLSNAGIPVNEFCRKYGINEVAELPFDSVNDALHFIANPDEDGGETGGSEE